MVSFSYRDGVRPVSLRQPAMPRKYLRISQRRLRASSGFHLVRPWPKERVTALSIFMAGIADSRARHSAADRYRLTLKRYAPIASAAAFPARHAVWQHVLHGFCGAILPDLSLRGGRRPTWQSREGSYVFADGFPVIRHCPARFPRRFAPRNDTSGWCSGAPVPLYSLISLHKALTTCKGHAASVRRQSRQRLRSERRYRRNRCLPFYRQPVRIGSIAPDPAVRSPTIANA